MLLPNVSKYILWYIAQWHYFKNHLEQYKKQGMSRRVRRLEDRLSWIQISIRTFFFCLVFFSHLAGLLWCSFSVWVGVKHHFPTPPPSLFGKKKIKLIAKINSFDGSLLSFSHSRAHTHTQRSILAQYQCWKNYSIAGITDWRENISRLSAIKASQHSRALTTWVRHSADTSAGTLTKYHTNFLPNPHPTRWPPSPGVKRSPQKFRLADYDWRPSTHPWTQRK